MSLEKDNVYVHTRLTEIFSRHPILKDKKLKKLNIPYPANQYEHEKIDDRWHDCSYHAERFACSGAASDY
jgi:hypothetical protein